MADKPEPVFIPETGESLSQKITKGAAWVSASNLFGKGFGVLSNIILARLLAPEDFGLMAIAVAVVSFSQGTTRTGFEAALIQKQTRPDDFLNTVWTFELTRCLILFIILFFAAPLLADFFENPKAVNILRVISMNLLFGGFRNIGVIFFMKNLDFRKQFFLEIFPSIISVCVVIPLAYSLRNVWALVFANLSASAATCIISYVMHPYRPRLDFNIQKATKLFQFGKWILGSSIVGIIREQGFSILLGKFLGISMLGLYNRAGVFSAVIFQQICGVVWKVGYPAYSQLQMDPERFKQAYLKTLQILTFIGIPMAGGLFVLSWDFVHLFLTDKWLPIVPLMQILCLQATLGFINTPASIVFYASGHPGIGTRISFLQVATLAILIYPLGSKWGLSGAVVSHFFSALFAAPFACYMAVKIAGCSFWEFFKPVIFPTINTCIMVAAVHWVKITYCSPDSILHFGLLVLLGGIIYSATSWFSDKQFKYGIYQLLKEKLRFIKAGEHPVK